MLRKTHETCTILYVMINNPTYWIHNIFEQTHDWDILTSSGLTFNISQALYIYISWNIDTWNRKIITRDSKLWGFPRYGGTPIAGWFIMEIPMNMDDLGYPYFRTPPYRFIDVFFYEILEYRWVQYCDSIYQHGKLGVWLANIAYEPP